MLFNYLKIAVRSLWKNKVYSFINVLGLSVGLAAGVLLLLWVQDELSFDTFHQQTADLYKLAAHFNQNGKEETWGSAPAPIAIFGLKEVPELENACRISKNWGQFLYQYQDKSIMQNNTTFVDESFFQLFNFPLIQGNPKKPFTVTRSMVITESIARKYFGSDNPIGKIIRVDNKHNYEVSGIIKDMPSNSSLRYEVLMPMAVVKEEFQGNGEWKTIDEDWGNYNYDIFFRLKTSADPKAAATKLTQLHRKAQPNEFTKSMNYLLQPMSRLHLYQADGKEGNIVIVRIMALVGGDYPAHCLY